MWLWMVALLFNMVYRGLGKVVDKAGDQQDFEVVEFGFGSGICVICVGGILDQSFI